MTDQSIFEDICQDHTLLDVVHDYLIIRIPDKRKRKELVLSLPELKSFERTILLIDEKINNI